MLIANRAVFCHDEDDRILLRKSECRERVPEGANKPKPQLQPAEDIDKREDCTAMVVAQSRAVEKLIRKIEDAMKNPLADREKRTGGIEPKPCRKTV